jgi:3D-(3,5/4)-trihydroxycyclohexane-1,2-dione acylhydrolase (decyclizing)
MMGISFTLVITDNRGFGCINRLQAATGGAAFNNLFVDSNHNQLPDIDYAAHAASMGAQAVKVGDIAELEAEVRRAVNAGGVQVVVIETDPGPSTAAGGAWWDVVPPAVSERKGMASVRSAYQQGRKGQNMGRQSNRS